MDIFEEKLNRLDVAYAINRAASITLNEKIRYVDQLVSLHRRIFFDTHGFESGEKQSGFIDSEDLLALEVLIQKLVKNFTIEGLADFYLDYQRLMPFKYGGNLTIRKFLTELAQIPKFLELLPYGIDFRYVEVGELESLDRNTILKMFKRITVKHAEKRDVKKKWPALPDSSLEIKGYKFLTYQKKYFVAMNGGIIEIGKIQKKLTQFLSKGFLPNEFFLKKSDFTKSIFKEGFLTELDGIDLSKDIPLFCLDIDHLTNLCMKTELPKLHMILRMEKISILDLPDLESIFTTEKLVAKAIKRIRILKNKVIRSVSVSFENKFPVQIGKAKFFMSMGGIGSGKSSLDKVARELTNNNFVLASIDLSRMSSDVFQFYLATNHHSDDYRTLVTYAYTLMGAIVNKAIEGSYNYFRDGSGIPYDKRNSDLIKIMKDTGYETHILVAAAAIYKERDRNDIISPAHKRIMDRYKAKKRAVPWEIVVDKHVNHPLAQTEACCDMSVDRLIVFDTMGHKGKTGVIGYIKNIPSGIQDELQSAKLKSTAALAKALKRNNLLLEKFEFENKNIDFLTLGMKNKFNFKLDAYEAFYRVFIVCNKLRLIDVLQKGALNADAKNYEDLVYNTHKFHVPYYEYPLDKRGNYNNFRLRHMKLDK